MAVVKEYRCLSHGPFDGKEARCPHGCTTVVREFRTPPAGHSEKTKRSDAALERLAQRYGLTDMSNRSGSVGGSRRPPRGLPDFLPRWGEVPKGDMFKAGGSIKPVEGSQGGVEALAFKSDVAQKLSEKYGKTFEAEQDVMSVLKTLPRPRPHVIGQPYGTDADLAAAMKAIP